MTALIDTTAAEAEGLVAITPEQKVRLKRYRQLKARKEAIEAEQRELRDLFGSELAAEANQGLILNGKVVVRRSDVSTPRIDTKRLKDEHPEIANELVLVTHSIRITID